MSTLPIRDALVKAHLTPAHIAKEMNSGLREAAGTIYSGVRDKYITTIENTQFEFNIHFVYFFIYKFINL